jgi:hypothetical protein
MLLKLAQITFCLAAVSVAMAQDPNYYQADSFHIANCSSPCVAELALSQVPTSALTISVNGVTLTPDLYQIDTSNGPQEIIISFSGSASNVQATDLVVATYTIQTASATPAGQ